MKKLCIIFILSQFFILFSCKNNISYKLINKSDYDVIVYDDGHIAHPEYPINAHSYYFIEHTDSGNFKIINNTRPIEIFNNFNFSEIKELNFYNISICNNTSNNYQLNILNSSHASTNTFTVSSNQTSTIKVYAKSFPRIELLNNNTSYNNYVFNDNTLVIY